MSTARALKGADILLGSAAGRRLDHAVFDMVRRSTVNSACWPGKRPYVAAMTVGGRTIDFRGIVRAVRLERDTVPSFARCPFSVPAVRALGTLELDAKATFLIGENGSRKSTPIEAIAIAAGFNPRVARGSYGSRRDAASRSCT